MNKLTRALWNLIPLGALALASVEAQTVSTPNNGTEVFAFGPGALPAFGETITVPLNANPNLQSFTFDGIASDNNSSFAYKTYIYAYNSTTNMETGSALYTSGVQTLPATGTVASTIMPGVTLVPGQSYIILLTASGLVQVSPNSSSAAASMSLTAGTYSGGTLLFTLNSLVNGFNTSTWQVASGVGAGVPAAFTAIFGQSVVVIPSFSSVGLTLNQQAILIPINQSFATGTLTPLAASLIPLGSNPATLGAALDQLSPQAFGQFSGMTAFNNASFETVAMDDYLAGQRSGPNGTFTGGNGAIDASGLTVNDPSYDPNLAMVHSRLLAWNPAASNGALRDVASPMLGGVDMKAETDPNSLAPQAASRPWNVYVRGNVVLAQGFSQQDVSHFNDNTESVVLGADYRLTPDFLVGLTAGYAHTDATLDDFGSSATVDSYSPGFYASYADHGWYANLSGNYLHNAYTQSRVIGFLGQTATSAPEGNEGVANLDGGYDFHAGALTFGPLAGMQYTHLTVDGYNESGSIANLSVNEQNSDSLRSRLGGRLSYAFAQHGISLTPHLEATWQHEFMDQSRGITSQFNSFGGGSFSIRTPNPSRESALIDAGLDANLNADVMLFADYIVQAGQDNYFGQSVQAGVKIGF